MVQRITPELLRKRSEHNDGDLSTLQEIALHQFDIERIECLDLYCKDLRILLLQNNQISKIENVSKLKALKYLNLALNNIKVIEGLEFCEDLEKLDLTVNFIEDLNCLDKLKANERLKDLYLVGNPCTQIEGYRHIVIATLPQLQSLDGKQISRSERLKAHQLYSRLSGSQCKVERDPLCDPKSENREPEVMDLQERKNRFQSEPTAHTPEARLAAAREIDEFHKPAAPKKNPYLEQTKRKPAKDREMVTANGKVFQCNEGNWAFTYEETANLLVLRLQLSKFLDSSFIDATVHSDYVRILIQGKLLQLVLPERVLSDCVIYERSTTTGELALTMLTERSRVDKRGNIVLSKNSRSGAELVEYVRRVERLNITRKGEDREDFNLAGKENSGKNRCKRLQVLADNSIKVVPSVPMIVPAADFVDDPDVPPLC